MARVFAAADIGSNTAHLLVAASDGELVMRIDNLNEWIALGEVVARKGMIPTEQQDQLIAATREFKRVSALRGAESLYVFATEAMRSASNHKEVIKRIKAETGITVDLIPSQREAQLSYLGACLDCDPREVGIMFELGGGSLQIATVGAGRMSEQVSLPLGTGRIIAEAGLESPCPKQALFNARAHIDRALETIHFDAKKPPAVATGGVARGLWRALHPDGEKKISQEELTYLTWSTTRLPIDRIVERFGVKAKRAGTLLPGALVYQGLLRKFNITEMSISEFGVREGAVLEIARGNI